ncbi:C-type lectin domain family 12 member B-like isoform X2 [Dermochelys coriacea]|uniref:C-type lectin domain family 12 member B-like isoform X2 n=1 Tax=Dermochelys coriacea TaxID=27794 RepID=UPI001CA7FF8C|nr:C-type lectin domain family 12 member B-like isoform X2 [Dermochelys coriacea]
MTEEITYADLEFNKPYALENIPKSAAPEEKGRPASFPIWRLAALTFLTLCLALLVGLLALGIVFFQVSSDFQKQIGNLKQNQETLQTSSSKRLQDMKDNLCLKGEEKNKNNGPNCILCPANWQWMGGDTCFYISREKRPWKQSREFCSLQNSTLLMLQDKEKLNHVPPRETRDNYWFGLSCKSEGDGWHWEDGSAFSAQRTDWDHGYKYYQCAYLYDRKIFKGDCSQKHLWICEKAAVQLRVQL